MAIGKAVGKDKITKAEAARLGAKLIENLGINSEEHLAAAQHPEKLETFRDRLAWSQANRPAWTESKPSTLESMQSHVDKHLLPRFGDMRIADITEKRVQEFVADLRRTTFEMKKPNGEVIKTYRLSRKSIMNIIGVLKLILGRKAWMQWEDLNLGKPPRAKQRYFTEAQMKAIIDASSGQYRVLWSFLAGTGCRIGEAAGMHVEDVDLENRVVHIRRGVWKGKEISTKTEAGTREIDIDMTLTDILRAFIGDRTSGLLFRSRRGTPLAHGNLKNRVLHPLLDRLGIPRAGLHAWRHARTTVLRRHGVSGDLQKKWLGHTSLRTGDRYSHTDEDVEFRRESVESVGLDRTLSPNSPKTETAPAATGASLKRSA